MNTYFIIIRLYTRKISICILHVLHKLFIFTSYFSSCHTLNLNHKERICGITKKWTRISLPGITTASSILKKVTIRNQLDFRIMAMINPALCRKWNKIIYARARELDIRTRAATYTHTYNAHTCTVLAFPNNGSRILLPTLVSNYAECRKPDLTT